METTKLITGYQHQELMAQYRVVSCTCETVTTRYSKPDYQSTHTLMREKCTI